MEVVNDAPSGGGDGANGKVPLNEKDQQRYNTLRAKAMLDMFNPQCIAFCLSHGINPGLLYVTLLTQQAFNGSKSTITQRAAHVGMPSGTTIAEGFRNPGVHAASSLGGTDVYFRQGGFLSSVFGNSNIQEATIEHEALHNAGWDDAQVKAKMGLANTSGTTDITEQLKANKCAH